MAAHGQRDLGEGSAVMWLGSGPLLGDLLGGRGGSHTVVLNTCESGAVPDFGLSQSSIAAGLLREGAHEVVATLAPVSDEAALAFAQTFYTALDAEANNTAIAVGAAQRALRQHADFAGDWSSYTLISLRRGAAPTGDDDG